MNETKTLDLTQFESQDKDKTPNVKKLWSPEVEQETDKLPFDPERDITEEDWEEMFSQLEKYRNENEWNNFAKLAMHMKIIDRKCNLGLSEDDWLRMKESLNELNEIWTLNRSGFQSWWNEWSKCQAQAMAMRIIDPNFIWKLDNSFSELENDFTEDEFYLNNIKSNSINLYFLTAIIRILNPQSNLALNDDDWILLKETLEDDRNENDWIGFSTQAMSMKIINPEIDLKLTKLDWQEMKKEMNKLSERGDYNNFSQLVSNMTILAAEKVEITGHGLKIIMPERKPPIKKTPPLPTKLNLN